MLPNIGFSLQGQYDRPVSEVIALLKKVGFSAVSPVWTPDLDLKLIAGCTGTQGMTIQSLHAPHKGIDLLWKPDTAAASEAQKNIIRSIDACARFQIPILVMHGWQGLLYTFPDKPLDFRFFDRIVPYAKQQGVSIAFENLEGEEYLAALMARYRNQPHIGFCWDSGHDHCYPHKTDFLKQYGDRLIMTHLNDNLGLRSAAGIPTGNDDLHFLPYDGNIDWDCTLSRLKNAPLQSILNFELKIRSTSTDPKDLIYVTLSLEQFLEKAATQARKIATQYAVFMGQT